MLDNTKTNLNQSGFSITELVVVMVVINILIVGLFATFTDFFASTARQNVSTELTIESQNILRDIVEEIRVGSGIRTNNTINDPNAPGGSWQTDEDQVVIIIAAPAKDGSDQFILNEEAGVYYENEYVYFEEGGQLYKRTLANPDAAGNTASTTCPPDDTDSCPNDLLLSSDFREMTFEFYDQDNNVTTDPLLARSVEMNINLERVTFGDPVQANNQTRITFRNNAL